MPLDNPSAYTPQPNASRNLSSIPGMGFLQQLLGREGAPILPPIQQVPTSELISEMNAARGVDPVRFGNIRDMIERRSPDDIARGPGPQAVETAGKTSAEPTKTFNPFKILSDALSGVSNDLSPGQ